MQRISKEDVLGARHKFGDADDNRVVSSINKMVYFSLIPKDLIMTQEKLK